MVGFLCPPFSDIKTGGQKRKNDPVLFLLYKGFYLYFTCFSWRSKKGKVCTRVIRKCDSIWQDKRSINSPGTHKKIKEKKSIGHSEKGEEIRATRC